VQHHEWELLGVSLGELNGYSEWDVERKWVRVRIRYL